ncbi:MFS family permease [Bradyrhizobium sp. LB1.3]
MSQTTTYAGSTGGAKSEIEASTIRAISWRLIPFLVLAYFFSYLDRVNLGFAALTMNAELKFTPLIFSWGAGIFFIGYFIFEVPSNLALEKFGASRWIARIMVTWGIISGLMALTSGVTSFYVLRFLLGVAEAGFFPGIILYLTYWYPAEYRARFLAAFAIAVPVSTVIGAPVSGLLLGLDGAMGLKGWQWLFIIEGIPSVLLGIVTWFYLTDRPEKADWLSAEQKTWLKSRLDSEVAAKQAVKHLSLGEALSSPKVIALSLVYFGFVGALYGMQFWLPQFVKAFGLTNAQTGFVTAIPYLFGTIAMILCGAALGRHARARDACRRAAAAYRRCACRLLLSHRSHHDDGGADCRRDRGVLLLRRVLDPADRLALRHGGGRRHRPDQLDRQPRRLRRSLPDRLGQGSHRPDLDRLVGAGGLASARRHPGVHRRPRQQARVRRTGAARGLIFRGGPSDRPGRAKLLRRTDR